MPAHLPERYIWGPLPTIATLEEGGSGFISGEDLYVNEEGECWLDGKGDVDILEVNPRGHCLYLRRHNGYHVAIIEAKLFSKRWVKGYMPDFEIEGRLVPVETIMNPPPSSAFP